LKNTSHISKSLKTQNKTKLTAKSLNPTITQRILTLAEGISSPYVHRVKQSHNTLEQEQDFYKSMKKIII
jgi:hypothetical protein